MRYLAFIQKLIYRNKVTKETFWALCAKFFATIGGVFVLIFVPKAVGVETFGSFSLVLALISIFGRLYGVSVHAAIKKEVTEGKWNASSKLYFIESLKVKIIASVVATFIVLMVINACNVELLKDNFFYFLMLLVTMNFWGSIVAVFEDTHRLVYEAVIYFIEYAVKIVVIVSLFFFATLNLKTLLLAFICGYGSALLLGSGIVIKQYGVCTVREILSFDKSVVKIIVTRTFFLTLTTLSMVLFGKIDMVMIAHFLSLDSVGFYAIASDFSKHAVICSMPFIIGVIPMFVKDEQPHSLFMRSLRTICLLNMLIGLLLIGCARYIVLLIYGEQFLQVVPVLMILALYPLFAVIQIFTQRILILFDKTKQIFIFGVGAVVLNIVLNALLIPIYGINGAAIATIMAYIMWNIISYMYTERLLREKTPIAVS